MRTVVGYVPYNWDHAVSILRIVRPLEHIGVQVIQGNLFGDIHPDSVSLGDVIVIQREFPDYTKQYEQIVARARAEGKAVVYEIDDLLLELPEDHPAHSTGYYTAGLFSILRAVVEADLVTTTTPTLQNYLRPLNPNTYVLHNYLDDHIWKLPDPRELSERSPVVIGYMGSKTHQADLKVITPVLTRLLDRHGDNLLLRFWGEEPPDSLQHRPNVEWIPLEMLDYAEFARYFSEQVCDIFLAPLIASFFNQCKSSIKYLEYSSQAIPGVYSRIEPYTSVINHGENGFLATSPEEWETCLTQLIENPSLRQHMGQKAQQNVTENWLLSQHAHEWRDVYRKALDISADVRARENRQEYVQFFTRTAIQVQDWHVRLQKQLLEKDKKIQNLQSQLSSLQARSASSIEFQEKVKHSTAWKFVRWAWRLRSWLLPPGSLRERLVLRGTKWLRSSRK